MLYLSTQLYHIRFQTRHLSSDHPICPWIQSSGGASAPLIAAQSRSPQMTVAAQELQVSSCCQEPAPRPVSMLLICLLAHVNPLHNVFRFRRGSRALSSWSSAPRIFLQPRILRRFFVCCWGRRVWVQIPQEGQLWLHHCGRARDTLPRRSTPTTTVPVSILCSRSQNHQLW